LGQNWRDYRDTEPDHYSPLPLETPPECLVCGSLLSLESRTCDVCGSPVSADQIVFGDEKQDLGPWFAAGVLEVPTPSLWRRAAAALIDLLMIALIISFVGGPLMFIIGTNAFGLLCAAIVAAYYILSYSSSGQTIGKKWLRMRVVAIDGASLDWKRGTLRFVGSIAGAVPLMLGYLWAFWDKDRQAWHDKLAGTMVIPEDYKFFPLMDSSTARTQARKWAAIIIIAVVFTVITVSGLGASI